MKDFGLIDVNRIVICIYISFQFGKEKMSDLNADKFCGLLAQLIKEEDMKGWIEIDLELLWSLLPQSVLHGLSNGEATYYLTLVSSAVHTSMKSHWNSDQRSEETSLSKPSNEKIIPEQDNDRLQAALLLNVS